MESRGALEKPEGTIRRDVVLFALLLSAAIRAGLVLHGALDPDESEHLNAAWLVGQGRIPYRDYWDHHAPLFFYLLAPLTRWLADDAAVYLVARVVMVLAAGLTLVLVYRLAQRVPGTFGTAPWAAVILLAFLPRFVEKTTEIRPDVLALVAWLGATLALVCWRERGTPKWLWLAGLALGTAGALSLKTAYGALGMATVVAGVSGRGPRGFARAAIALGRLGAASSVVPLALLGWLRLAGGPAGGVAIVEQVILANLRFADFTREKPVTEVGYAFVGLALAGLVLTLRREGRRFVTHPLHGPVGIPLGVIGIILLVPATPGVGKHAWLPVLAGLAVYAGVAVAALREDGGRWRLRAALLSLAVVLGVLVPAAHLTRLALRPASAEPLRVAGQLLRDTCPGEPILDGSALAVFRPSAYRYRTLINGVRAWIATGAIPEARLVDEIRTVSPRVAYPDDRMDELPQLAAFIQDRYVPQPDGVWRLGLRVPVGGPPFGGRAGIELLAPGQYRLALTPGLEVAIDHCPVRPGVLDLTAGPHELAWAGAPGVITLTAATCAERAAADRP